MYVTEAIEKGLLTTELAKFIPTYCSYCGTALEIDIEQTHLYCDNEFCDRLLANRLESMCKILAVDGFGQEICMDVVTTHNMKHLHEAFNLPAETLTSHYNADHNIYLWENLQLAREQTLATIVKALSLPKIGSLSDKIFAGYSDIDSFYADFTDDPDGFISSRIGKKEGPMVYHISNTLLEREDLVRAFVDQFIVKQVAKDTIVICITGSVNGYSSKELFIKNLNDRFSGHVTVNFKGSLSKDVDFLLSEKRSNSSKFKKAEKDGIRIANSEEFVAYLVERYGNGYDKVSISEGNGTAIVPDRYLQTEKDREILNEVVSKSAYSKVSLDDIF